MKTKNLFYVRIACIVCLLFALTGCNGNTGNTLDEGNNGNTGTYYTVTFDSRGGSAVESQRVREGNTARSPGTPTRENYSFIGWYKSAEDNADQWLFETDRVNSDVTLYAKWQSDETQPIMASLTYERNSIGYTVTGAMGQEERIIIPAEHEGLPVTEIGESAFAYSRHTSGITYVSIPNTVTTIALNAFYGRSELVTVDIGGSSQLVSICNNAFSGNRSLESIYIPQGVTEIGDSAFNNCGSLESVSVAPTNTVYRSENGHLIETATQTLIRGVNNATVPDGVKSIAQAAFRRANGITELNVPKSVENIENYFIADSTIEKINYAGTQDEWNAIEKNNSMWNYGNRNVEVVFEATPSDDPNNGILIVYFSYTGNTKEMAEYIEKYTGGTLVEIIAQVPYTAADTNYNDNNSRCQTERRDDARPEISQTTYSQIDIDEYETVFIGYPMWNGEEPMIIRTFIEHYGELKGKDIYTFSSSGSSSPNSMNAAMKARYDETNIISNLHLTRSTLSQAETRIQAWVQENGLLKTTEENIMYIKVNGHTLTATLVDNSTAKALVEELKKRDITIDMRDYGNMEKVGALGVSLPRNDEQINTEAGDIIWYQGSSLVIYYDTNSWNFTRVGKIQNVTGAELKDILGSGNVTVTLSLTK